MPTARVLLAFCRGTVVDAHDGEDDMNTQLLGQPANYVILDNGGSQYSLYWHMRKNSVAVSPGQLVLAGTQIGSTGSSGPCRPGASNWVAQVPIRREPYVRSWTFANVPFTGNAALPWDQVTRTGSFMAGFGPIHVGERRHPGTHRRP